MAVRFSRRSRGRNGRRVILAAAVSSLAFGQHAARAAVATWSGANNADFENPLNWSGGTGGAGTGATAPVAPAAPAPSDATTGGDVATFTGAPPLNGNQPTLSESRSITGINFSNAAATGYTLGSSSAANVLTVGTSGILSSATSNTNMVSANLSIATNAATLTNETWSAAAGGTLSFTGSIAAGTVLAPVSDDPLLLSGAGTVVFNPSANNSISIVSNNSLFGSSTNAPFYASNGTVDFGSGPNSTASNNVIASTNTTPNPAPGLRYAGANTTLNVYSGTWRTNDIGNNNSNTATGKLNVLGGSLITGGGRYLANYLNGGGAVVTVNGGYLGVAGSGGTEGYGYLGVGLQGSGVTNGATAQVNVQSGVVDVAKNSTGSTTIGVNTSATASVAALINQSGGLAMYGVSGTTNALTGATVASGSSNGLNIGVTGIGSSGSGTTLQYTSYSNQTSAYTLAGGVMQVAGTLAGVAPGASGVNGSAAATNPGATVNPGSFNYRNFNFVGGTLTVGTFNATNLGSAGQTATATSGQVAASNSVGTLENYGGTLAPGGSIVALSPDSYGNVTTSLTPTTGKTTITGNYAGNGGNSTLAFNLSGVTAAAAFQDPLTTTSNFSDLAVSGMLALNDNLQVNLLNGLNPVGDTFKIITFTSGGLSGNFIGIPNVGGTGAGVTSDGKYTFTVNYDPADVTLNNFVAVPVPEPIGAGLIGLGGVAILARRRRTA